MTNDLNKIDKSALPDSEVLIAVHDLAGLMELPVGTVLRDNDDSEATDYFERLESGLWHNRYWDLGDIEDSTHDELLVECESYMPLFILNPEILGDFGPTYAEGDEVLVLFSLPEDERDSDQGLALYYENFVAGARATVIDQACSEWMTPERVLEVRFEDDETRYVVPAQIKPAPRFKVDDRVVLVDTPYAGKTRQVGAVGVVSAIYPDKLREVGVRIDNDSNPGATWPFYADQLDFEVPAFEVGASIAVTAHEAVTPWSREANAPFPCTRGTVVSSTSREVTIADDGTNNTDHTFEGEVTLPIEAVRVRDYDLPKPEVMEAEPTPEPRFKVGDRVQIIDNNYVGKVGAATVGTVLRTDVRGWHYDLDLDGVEVLSDEIAWGFNESHLAPYDESAPLADWERDLLAGDDADDEPMLEPRPRLRSVDYDLITSEAALDNLPMYTVVDLGHGYQPHAKGNDGIWYALAVLTWRHGGNGNHEDNVRKAVREGRCRVALYGR